VTSPTQLDASALKVREDTSERPPECFGVFPMSGEMGQLVHNDVVDQCHRRHHDAPIETQRPILTAASPAVRLTPDNDAGRPHAQARRIVGDALTQLRFGSRLIPLF